MSKKKIIFLSILVSLFILSFGHEESKIGIKAPFFVIDTPAYSEKSVERKLLDIVEKLPEYQQKAKYIQSLTMGKRGISTMIEKPTEEEPGYHKVTVGYSGDTHFETYYLFYVNTETSDVKIVDDMTGEVVSMEIWRQRQAENNKVNNEG